MTAFDQSAQVLSVNGPLRAGIFQLRLPSSQTPIPLQGASIERGFGSPGPYLIATTTESGPVSGSTRVCEKPASRIQACHSAPVKSKPPVVSISMFRLINRPKAFWRRSSSMIDL